MGSEDDGAVTPVTLGPSLLVEDPVHFRRQADGRQTALDQGARAPGLLWTSPPQAPARVAAGARTYRHDHGCRRRRGVPRLRRDRWHRAGIVVMSERASAGQPLSGTQHRLQAAGYEAVVASVGASLPALRYAGRDLVVPFHADEVRPAYRGVTLAPWP